MRWTTCAARLNAALLLRQVSDVCSGGSCGSGSAATAAATSPPFGPFEGKRERSSPNRPDQTRPESAWPKFYDHGWPFGVKGATKKWWLPSSASSPLSLLRPTPLTCTSASVAIAGGHCTFCTDTRSFGTSFIVLCLRIEIQYSPIPNQNFNPHPTPWIFRLLE